MCASSASSLWPRLGPPAGRRSAALQLKYPLGLTSSTSHISVIGQRPFTERIQAYLAARPAQSTPRLFFDIALHLQPHHLGSQPGNLRLLGRHHWRGTAISCHPRQTLRWITGLTMNWICARWLRSFATTPWVTEVAHGDRKRGLR